MGRLIFLNRYFSPDQSATSQLVSDLAFHLAVIGEEVHVVTGNRDFDAPDQALAADEVINGVNVHRVSMSGFGRSTLHGRALDYLSFFKNMRDRTYSIARPGDVLVAKTDPPLLSILASRIAKKSGAILINWLQDLYPEVAIELGVPFVQGPVGGALKVLRNRSLLQARINIVLGERMAARLQDLGINNTEIVPNWVDDAKIRPHDTQDNPLRREWGLQDKFIIGYSGNLGRAHEIRTILRASGLLRNDKRMAFLTIGGGYLYRKLRDDVLDQGMSDYFRFLPYQSHEHLPLSLTAPDVHWISLRPELEGLIVPSKFYGIAAAGKPMIAIAAQNGEIATLIKRYQCGVVVAPGDGPGFASAITFLADNAEIRTRMGQRARDMLDRNFSRAKAFQRWQNVLAEMREVPPTAGKFSVNAL